MISELLWEASSARKESSHLFRFMREWERQLQIPLTSFEDLHAASLTYLEQFWRKVWDFTQVIASHSPTKIIESASALYHTQWFSGATLNFAENLLRRRDTDRAIVFWGEDRVRRQLTYAELYRRAAQIASFLRGQGIHPGDRVAAVLPNAPEAVVAMLGTAACGAVWSSVSPDFGVDGIAARFAQIEPKILFLSEGYFFRGKWISCADKLTPLQAALPSLQQIVLVPYGGESLPGDSSLWSSIVTAAEPPPAGVFTQMPASAPLYILYSSGTTGAPKCIIHSIAGTLLEHLKEHQLHTDVHSKDLVFYQTSCSWMMWNWLVSALASGAALALYDGDPLFNQGRILFDFAEQERISIFGTNAKYLSLLEKNGLSPRASHNLSELHTMLSTGSPLLSPNYDYVYSEVKQDLALSSISGGTDIIGCFALGSPLSPVWRGELQARSLGLDVKVFDERGTSVINQKGELVCTNPFPSMPVGFWADPDGSKYRKSYFERFPGAWHHGDFAMLTERGSMVIYGRSDTTLKPGGVRVGTAEIYRQLESHPDILDALVVGQQWKGDVRIVLFLVLRQGKILDDAVREDVKRRIRVGTSPFHVPKKVIQISEVPRTRSGKIVELAVARTINGDPATSTDALSNPQALEAIACLPELKED